MYPRVAAGLEIIKFTSVEVINLLFAGPGSAMGLTLILYSNFDDYYCSSTNSAGFKVN